MIGSNDIIGLLSDGVTDRYLVGESQDSERIFKLESKTAFATVHLVKQVVCLS